MPHQSEPDSLPVPGYHQVNEHPSSTRPPLHQAARTGWMIERPTVLDG
jgi:hypothetical protein